MADRPMIFSGSMVKALLDGRKTMTRRVLKPQPVIAPNATPFYQPHPTTAPREWHCCLGEHTHNIQIVRYAPGDRLYVREAFTLTQHDKPVFRADATDADGYRWHSITPGDSDREVRWRSPIHMPRWASRITLTVTEVRVERVQSISEDDAVAEGMEMTLTDPTTGNVVERVPGDRNGFACFWDELNGKKPGCAWADNPWVAAIRFTVANRNIDQESDHV